jgi:hypothetical protein
VWAKQKSDPEASLPPRRPQLSHHTKNLPDQRHAVNRDFDYLHFISMH